MQNKSPFKGIDYEKNLQNKVEVQLFFYELYTCTTVVVGLG